MPNAVRRSSRLSLLSRSSHGSSHGETRDDDCWSVGSTLSVNRNGKTRYMVKFDRNSTVKYKRGPIEEDEMKNRWYTKKDYSKWTDKRFALGQSMEKEDRQNSKKDYSETGHFLLGKLYDKCNNAKDDKGQCLLKKKDVQKLAAVLQSGTRVGMECASHSDIVTGKLDRRYNILRKVMAAQSFGSGTVPIHIMLSGPNVDPEEDAKRASEKYSLTSRLFARHIAEAAAMQV